MVKNVLAGVLLLASVNAGAEVYYCADVASIGFGKENGAYTSARFPEQKFKMNLDLAKMRITIKRKTTEIYQCKITYPHQPGLLQCSEEFYHFHFNATSGRYVSMHGYGIINDGTDSVSVSHGTCEKFD